MNIRGTNISITRGDSGSITLDILENGENYILSTGDVIYFTVKDSIYSDVIIFQKVIDSFGDGVAIIELEPGDTKPLDMNKVYKYDIQLNTRDGRVITVIKPSDFMVTGEVTYE